MKVVIIGYKGMLGQQLAKTFGNENPILWDRENIDIANKRQVHLKIAEIKPGLVINAAAYNDVDGAEKNESLANQINGLAVGYLADATRASGGILVHYSSDYVFKGDQKGGYSEKDTPDPQSVYAHSKYLGEQLLQRNMDQFYLIRPSRIFGPTAVSSTAKKSFVELMLKQSETKKELNVINEELSCPTYSIDLAERTKRIIDSRLPFGIYHVTNSGACTWYEFAREIFNIKKITITLNPVMANFFPREAVRPFFSILLNTKLPALRNWRAALKEYLQSI